MDLVLEHRYACRYLKNMPHFYKELFSCPNISRRLPPARRRHMPNYFRMRLRIARTYLRSTDYFSSLSFEKII
jgi:hypothetical protein